jgi:branched-chain amino acid transport system permease protein
MDDGRGGSETRPYESRAGSRVRAPARVNGPASLRGRWETIPERRRHLIYLAIGVAAALLYPTIDSALNLGLMGAAVPIAVFVVLAVGLNIVVGYAGLLDLGYAAFFAIGAYTMAFLTSPQSVLPFGTSFWIALAISFFVAALFGVILGAPTLRLRGDYLAIVTLAFGEIVPDAVRNMDTITRGNKGLSPIGQPTVFGVNLGETQTDWYFLLLAVLALTVFMIIRLHDSRLGRAWKAMREDELAASSMGIDLVQTKLLAFGLGASFSGFAGSMYAGYIQAVDPAQFRFDTSIIVLAAVILGGMGNIWGVIGGAVLIGTFDRVLADRLQGWVDKLGNTLNLDFLVGLPISTSKMLVFGAALVLTMVLRPEGLFPNRARKAELHPAQGDEAEAAQETLYDTRTESERV